LRLSFSADSWVDVHDASGRRTFAGNGLANSVKTIAGAAPLRVYLGSGSGVQLEINDRAVAIGPQFFAGEVARFEAGADGVLDGRGDSGPGRTLLGPTIVEVSDPESALAREEVFGPVLSLHRATDIDAALEFVNGSRYGNAGSIFTTSGAAARAYRYGAGAGMLGVNIGVPAPVAWFPFAGWKDSIDGDLHANGTDAVDFYTRKKVITSRW